MVGLVNLIFTVTMILLAVKFWSSSNIAIKVILMISIALFTVIQPLAIYTRAKRQVASVPEEIEIGFNDKGVHVTSGQQSSYLKWKSIKGISKRPTMVIVFSTQKHGFILTNKVLGKDRDPFYDYVLSKIQN